MGVRPFLGAYLIGAIMALGHAPFSLPGVAIFGCVLAFHLWGRMGSVRRAAWFGWAVGGGYFTVTLHWIVEPFLVAPEKHAILAPFALLGLGFGLALFWAAAFGVARHMGRWWAIAITMGTAELLRGYVFTGFPWGLLIQGWVDHRIAQTVAWVGSYGATFLLFFIAAIAAQRRFSHAALGAILALLGLCFWPAPAADPAPATAPIVRVVQPNAPQHQKWDPDFIHQFWRQSLASTGAGDPPDLILWPETSVPVRMSAAAGAFDEIRAHARAVPVIAGINRDQDWQYYNAAVLIGADDHISGIYNKTHLVPFGEYMPLGALFSRLGVNGFAARDGYGFAAGAGPVLFDVPRVGLIQPLICYEAVFARDLRGVDRRPRALAHLTNDAWFGKFSGPYQHLVQARLRAIESGLPMIRAANTGVSAIIAPNGAVVAQTEIGHWTYAEAALPLAKNAPLYWRMGELPTLIFFIFMNGLLMLRPRKTEALT